MQINYPYMKFRRSSSPGFWYPPSIQNSLQAMDTPVVYAPYGTDQFWPNETVNGNSVLNTPDKSLAPNSGQGNNVTSAAIASGFGDAPPAASPAVASATGQSLGPVSLVAPMPSITQPPSSVTATPAPACNSMDSWVNSNPMLAALGIVGVFLLLGGKR